MNTLELSNNEQTQISCLSRGECERLSIVVEMFDNPAIFFLMN
jgi:ABC-type multidrug transport system ATPase subunit